MEKEIWHGLPEERFKAYRNWRTPRGYLCGTYAASVLLAYYQDYVDEQMIPSFIRQKKATDSPADNLSISIQLASDEPKAAMIIFEPQFWAEPIGFKIKTSKKIINHVWQYPGFKGMQQVSISELKNEYEFGVQIANHNIKPKVPFILGVVFDNLLWSI